MDIMRLRKLRGSREKEGMTMKVYVWDEFEPNESDGLAVAIANSEEEARDLISLHGWHDPVFGKGPKVYDLDGPMAFCVSGGG